MTTHGTDATTATQDVMEFLSQPDLDFGDALSDVDVLAAPGLLRQRAAQLLDADIETDTCA